MISWPVFIILGAGSCLIGIIIGMSFVRDDIARGQTIMVKGVIYECKKIKGGY